MRCRVVPLVSVISAAVARVASAARSVTVVAVVVLVCGLTSCVPPPDAAVALLPPSVTVVAGVVGRGVADGVGEAARFDGPAGLAVSPDGSTAYLADTFVGTIRTVDLATGTTSTLLGRPHELVAVDGIGDEVRLAAPRGLAVSPDHTVLWVGDGASLRRVELSTLETTTVAGDQTAPGDLDGAGADARFGFLLHDLEDDGTSVYATDRINDKLRAIDRSTFVVTTLATGLNGPGGLARDGAVLYVADTFAGAVKAVDLAASAAGAITIVADGLVDPQGVELVDGALFTLGFDAVVARISLAAGDAGTVTTLVAGEPNAATFDGVDGNLGGAFASLAAVAGGVVFVDLTSSALRRVAIADGTIETIAGPETPFGFVDGAGGVARMQTPYAIAAAADGSRWFIADTFNHAVRVIEVKRSDATVSATLSYQTSTLGAGGSAGFQDGPLAQARFRFPVGLAFDDARSLYVADSGNQRIRVIDLDAGTVRTLAGSGATGGADGAAGDAAFSDPWDVALDVDGQALYVADSSGNTVRKVDIVNGNVETVLGSFGDNDHVDGPKEQARIRVPVGVALAGGRLYVSDFEAHTIRALELATGEVTTAIGVDGFEGFIEGGAADALLASPSGLSSSADGGAIFVAETGSHVVRRLAVGDHSSRFVVGRAGEGGGLATGQAFSYAEATLLAPEDVAAFGLDLVVLSDHGVIHAVSVP